MPIAAQTTIPKTSHVPKLVRFGVGAPQFGQFFALLLTSLPHSLHFTMATAITSL
jgi:hypothetical protein